MSKSVAAVQMDCTGTLENNANTVIRLLQQLKKEEPDIILAVFPEMCLYGYDNLEKLKTNFTQKDFNNCLEKIAATCRQLRIEAFIGAPFYENDHIYNSLYFVENTGDFSKVYSKMHLIEAEKNCFTAGNEYKICQTSLGKAGLLICWDAAFCEGGRHYAYNNADFLVVSAAWEFPYIRQWELSTAGRSFDNSLPLVASNEIGSDSNCMYFGYSAIYDNLGNTMSVITNGREGYAVAKYKSLIKTEERNYFGSQIDGVAKQQSNSQASVGGKNLLTPTHNI